MGEPVVNGFEDTSPAFKLDFSSSIVFRNSICRKKHSLFVSYVSKNSRISNLVNSNH